MYKYKCDIQLPVWLSFSSRVCCSWVRAALMVFRLTGLLTLVSGHCLVLKGLNIAGKLYRRRKEKFFNIRKLQRCPVMFYISIEHRDRGHRPVWGGDDLQCVRAAPAHCLSSWARWSPAAALQWELLPVSLLLSASSPSSPAAQPDISQWSASERWRTQCCLLSLSPCLAKKIKILISFAI